MDNDLSLCYFLKQKSNHYTRGLILQPISGWGCGTRFAHFKIFIRFSIGLRWNLQFYKPLQVLKAWNMKTPNPSECSWALHFTSVFSNLDLTSFKVLFTVPRDKCRVISQWTRPVAEGVQIQICQKVHLWPQNGPKWGFCRRVRGWGSKSPLFGSKRSTFKGPAPPESILATDLQWTTAPRNCQKCELPKFTGS